MNIKIFSLVILISAVFNSPVFAEIKCSIDGENLKVNYKNTEYKTSVSGNAVMEQFQKGNSAFFEVHINPSLSELVVFNIKTKKFTTYMYTRYFINNSMDILTVVDPPHFSSEESDIESEIFVNGNSVCKFEKSIEIDVKISAGNFDIYSDDKMMGTIGKNKKNWVLKKLK